jgi:hypothetical protein
MGISCSSPSIGQRTLLKKEGVTTWGGGGRCTEVKFGPFKEPEGGSTEGKSKPIGLITSGVGRLWPPLELRLAK